MLKHAWQLQQQTIYGYEMVIYFVLLLC